jgi:putative endonuclease
MGEFSRRQMDESIIIASIFTINPLQSKQDIGKIAENFACRYLIRHGFSLIDKNFRTRFGEIDLIMEKASLIVFVEVRARKKFSMINSIESVDYFKQQRLLNTAHIFLQTQPDYFGRPTRFDVLGLQKGYRSFKVKWVKNAFEMD